MLLRVLIEKLKPLIIKAIAEEGIGNEYFLVLCLLVLT